MLTTSAAIAPSYCMNIWLRESVILSILSCSCICNFASTTGRDLWLCDTEVGKKKMKINLSYLEVYLRCNLIFSDIHGEWKYSIFKFWCSSFENKWSSCVVSYLWYDRKPGVLGRSRRSWNRWICLLESDQWGSNCVAGKNMTFGCATEHRDYSRCWQEPCYLLFLKPQNTTKVECALTSYNPSSIHLLHISSCSSSSLVQNRNAPTHFVIVYFVGTLVNEPFVSNIIT